MEYLSIIKAFETIVGAAPLDIQFSTQIHSVLDGEREEAIVFTLAPLTGEVLEEDGVFEVFNVDCVLSQMMEEEQDDTERNESLSMLHRNMVNIFMEFRRRHVDTATTVNGESLSCLISTPPTIEVMWNEGINNINAAQMTLSIMAEKPVSCSTVNALFSY